MKSQKPKTPKKKKLKKKRRRPKRKRLKRRKTLSKCMSVLAMRKCSNLPRSLYIGPLSALRWSRQIRDRSGARN
jgi:hypothetical protein